MQKKAFFCYDPETNLAKEKALQSSKQFFLSNWSMNRNVGLKMLSMSKMVKKIMKMEEPIAELFKIHQVGRDYLAPVHYH